MRRWTSAAVSALCCLVLVATPAWAQRDPFHPVIDPNAGVVSTTDTTTGTSTTVTEVPSGVGSDSLADTGADVAPWLAIAYTLILMGAGAIVIARLYGREPARSR